MPVEPPVATRHLSSPADAASRLLACTSTGTTLPCDNPVPWAGNADHLRPCRHGPVPMLLLVTAAIAALAVGATLWLIEDFRPGTLARIADRYERTRTFRLRARARTLDLSFVTDPKVTPETLLTTPGKATTAKHIAYREHTTWIWAPVADMTVTATQVTVPCPGVLFEPAGTATAAPASYTRVTATDPTINQAWQIHARDGDVARPFVDAAVLLLHGHRRTIECDGTLIVIRRPYETPPGPGDLTADVDDAGRWRTRHDTSQTDT